MKTKDLLVGPVAFCFFKGGEIIHYCNFFAFTINESFLAVVIFIRQGNVGGFFIDCKKEALPSSNKKILLPEASSEALMRSI